jgi:abequosyltransferase
MPDSAPLLTIAIPTFSRTHLLEGLLEVLLEQLEGESRVELLISDNASTDSTGATVAAYQARGLSIRYIRNETNIGPDRNILQCFLLASGDYVWVFSDDDLILPGTIKRVLDVLSLGVYDIVNITACLYQEDGGHLEERTGPLGDVDFSGAKDFAGAVHVFFTFISGVILHKKRISSLPHRPFESILDTNLTQLGPVYSALNCHRRSLLIRDPLIAARSNSNVGYALYRVFGTTFEKITREWIDDESVRQAIFNGTIRRFLPFWIIPSRELRASSVPEDPHQILRICYGSNMRYWVFIYPIYALPLSLARFWLLGVRVINKIDSILGGLLSKS